MGVEGPDKHKDMFFPVLRKSGKNELIDVFRGSDWNDIFCLSRNVAPIEGSV